MRTELQLLEHWLRLLASHAGIAPAAFNEIHALCQGLDADMRIVENTAEEALMTATAQRYRIIDLERALGDALAEAEAASAEDDIRDRQRRAGH